MTNEILRKEQTQKVWGEILDIVHPHFRKLNEGTPNELTSGILALIERENRQAELAILDKAEGSVKKWRPTDYKGYSAGGGLIKGMTLDDHKRNFAKEILANLSALRQEVMGK